MWPLHCLAFASTMELRGADSAIRFSDSGRYARLSASCEGAAAQASWLAPRAVEGVPVGNITVELLGVPASCVGLPLSTPCAQHDSRMPPLFWCGLEGNVSVIHSGPHSAYPVAVSSPGGIDLGVAVRLSCPWPSYSELLAAVGYAGDGSVQTLRVSISYLAQVGADHAQPIDFAELPGHGAANSISLTGLPRPPSSPTAPPPLQPPWPPSPPPPLPTVTSCAGLLTLLEHPTSGSYMIDPTGSDPFMVYCDFSGGGAWAVVKSYQYANRANFATMGTGIANNPRNGASPSWDDYSLSLARITALRAVTTKMQIRCATTLASSLSDYVIADVGLLFANGEGLSSAGYNVVGAVRNYPLADYNMHVWQSSRYDWVRVCTSSCASASSHHAAHAFALPLTSCVTTPLYACAAHRHAARWYSWRRGIRGCVRLLWYAELGTALCGIGHCAHGDAGGNQRAT